MANPTWTDDERILALDLYLREGALGPNHPDVVELSRLLRSMAATTGVSETYRNPNGVSKKLYNFADLEGKSGLPGWGAGDKRLFERYRDQRDELDAAASAIREKAAAAPRSYARQLLLKWQPALEPRTLELHREKATQAGSVWWGNYTEHGRRVSDAVVEDLDAQIAAGIRTYAFFYRSGGSPSAAEVWRAQVLEVTTDPDRVDDRLPGYYRPTSHNLFVRVQDFQPLAPGEVLERLALASNPRPGSLTEGALGNQQTPIYVVDLQEGMVTATTVAGAMVPPQPELTLAWLAEQTLWSPDALEEIIDALASDEPQVALAGPPGTSKTWVARYLARFLTQDDDARWRVVQFHPSYGYESFMEGLRPVVKDDGVDFDVTPGVLVDMVRAAERARDGAMRVLVLDEMNRANLPRVLGELLYLFDYRDQPVDLLYSKGFVLPEAFRFIGTMNTADRSIRSLDTALRRRFYVFECGPDPRILERYYQLQGVTSTIPVGQLVSGFEALNAALTDEGQLDRHHTIGHSFLMATRLTPARLRRIWRHRIIPLIEEYFFDQPDLAEGFTVDRFWPGAA